MNGNTPTIVGSTAAHATYAADKMMFAANVARADGGLGQLVGGGQLANFPNQPQQALQLKGFHMSARRVVQVFIADPNENLSLDDCLLFKGEEKLTDATDQELFFELDIKDMLEKHNAKRVTVIDKKVKDRTEYLEPAKVRDLKMVVVTVASL